MTKEDLLLLKREKVFLSKSKGQNFLINNKIIKKIISQVENINKKNILEIGPGIGALTNYLKDAKKYIGVEIDSKLFSILKKKFSDLKFINSDCLKISYEDIFNGEPYIVISNLPYNISKKIAFKLLKCSKINQCILMFQKEVANSIIANPGEKKYSSNSLIFKNYSEISQVCNVNQDNFFPAPKVDSKVLNFKIKKNRIDDIEEYNLFIKICFKTRRKTLFNNLKNHKNIETTYLKKMIIKYFNNSKIRAEEISNISLYNFYKCVF